MSRANDQRAVVSSGAPKVLLVTAYRWPTTTRLALALSAAGITVDALCPLGHSLAKVKFVANAYRYRPLHPLSSLPELIAISKPDIIIPADDTVAAQLHELYQQQDAAEAASKNLRSLIANSLGEPTNYPIFYSRTQLASVARAAGVLSPETTNICSSQELSDQLKKIGLPAVLKTDGSFGGMGVAIVRTDQDAKLAFHKLNAYYGVGRTLKRLIVNRDANLVLPCVRGISTTAKPSAAYSWQAS